MEGPFTGGGEELTMTIHRESNLKLRWAPILAAFLVLASGCLVGPNYKPPPPPQVTGYTPVPPQETGPRTNVNGGEAQRLVSGQDIPGEWWTLFHSRPLNDLIARALKASPDFKAAQAALLVAHENALAQYGAYFPNAS